MYAYLWRHLPGSTPLKLIQAVLLFLIVVAVLFLWVFPWLVPILPLNDVTVGASFAGLVGRS